MKDKQITICHLLIALLLVTACSTKKKANEQPLNPVKETSIKYAKGFNVIYEEGVKWVNVPEPYQGAEAGFKYLLVQKGTPVPEHDDNTQVIRVPIDKIVCTSTTHIPLLDYLGETNALIGFPTTDYISSEKMRKRIEEGYVAELGVDNEINLEVLVLKEPDLVMAYTMSGNMGQFKQMQEVSIPVVINSEYLEKHPLGRAEWIKFMALFFNKEKQADSIFSKIEKDYNALASKANEVVAKPTVLSGIVYGDTWYLPGGENYAAKLIRDAGGNYLWADNSSSGFLELNFEAVYNKADSADFWIGVGSFKSLDEMTSSDERYGLFSAFKKENVYTYDAKKGDKGGSTFLELGYLRPDLIISDLIKILHPDLLDDNEFYFHARLK